MQKIERVLPLWIHEELGRLEEVGEIKEVQEVC
jgi:hypothetical protein